MARAKKKKESGICGNLWEKTRSAPIPYSFMSIVEYYKLEDIHGTICVDTRVPLIRQVADSRVWMVILSSGGESSMHSDGECQIMAITFNLRDSNLSSAGKRYNRGKTHVFLKRA